MTDIKADACRLCSREALPLRWAAELGRQLEARLGTADCEALQERVVSLDPGVLLAHIRTGLVDEPTLGVYKLLECENDRQPWLWMVVLIPQADASRHLGWMAHLAAGLHDRETRGRVFGAVERGALLEALDGLVAKRTHRFLRPGEEPRTQAGSATPTPSSEEEEPYRMVIAILKEESFVDDLLALFVEHDVRGATVLEARGMAEHLAAHMSLFAGFRSAFKAVGHSQIVLSLVPLSRTEEVLEMVRMAAGGMETPGAGIAFAIDVPQTIGLRKGG